MNICFIGNSVSAQREGYRGILQRLIVEQLSSDATFVNCSLGGIGSLGVSFFIDRFIRNKQIDICFVETFVADLKGATPTTYISSALRGIMLHPSLQKAIIIPLLLYRSDVDDDAYANMIKLYEEAYGPYFKASIDVFSVVRELVKERHTNAREVVYDEIHTTAYGAELYAEYIFSRMHSIAAECKESCQWLRDVSAIVPSKSVDFLPRIVSDEYVSGLFRLSLPYAEIERGNHIDVVTEGGACLGLIVVADSDTGVIELMSDSFLHTAQLYDAWCTQQRLQVVIFPRPIKQHRMLRITASSDSFALHGANTSAQNAMQQCKNIKVVGLMEFDANRFRHD